MKPKSAQAKGDRLENHLVEKLRQCVDSNTHRTSGSGNGLDKNDIRIPSLNIEIEAKNQQTINIRDWWKQTEAQLTSGNIGVLAIRHPDYPEFQKTLIVTDLEDWIGLLQSQGGERVISQVLDSKAKWKIQSTVQNLKDIIKILGHDS